MPSTSDVFPSRPTGAYRNYAPVTPSDSVNFASPKVAQALLINVGGTLSVVNEANQTVNLTVPAGWWFGTCIRVNATGTAATGISRYW